MSTIKIVSEKSFFKQAENPTSEGDNAQGKVYFVRKAINTRAEQADGWFYDIEWQDIYERGCSTGIWELQTATEVVEVKHTKRDKTKPSRASGSAKAKKVIKKVVTEVEKDLPARGQVSPSKKASRAKSEADSEVVSYSSCNHHISQDANHSINSCQRAVRDHLARKTRMLQMHRKTRTFPRTMTLTPMWTLYLLHPKKKNHPPSRSLHLMTMMSLVLSLQAGGSARPLARLRRAKRLLASADEQLQVALLLSSS